MIAREALLNAVRHGQPRSVSLHVLFDRAKVQMRVIDDGRGFDPGLAASSSDEHYGLTGIRERTREIGAECIVMSEPGRGTEIRIAVPFRRA